MYTLFRCVCQGCSTVDMEVHNLYCCWEKPEMKKEAISILCSPTIHEEAVHEEYPFHYYNLQIILGYCASQAQMHGLSSSDLNQSKSKLQ